MPTLQELQSAFVKADNAGNTDDAQAFATAIKNYKDQPVVQAGAALNALPGYLGRQAGLTARYALEGPAEALQIVTEPTRQLLTNHLLPGRPLGEEASRFADWIGLPKPETSAERVAGAGSKLVAGSGGVSKTLQALGNYGPQALIGLRDAANAMGVQLGSAAGSGVAGQASKEAGGNVVDQTAASVVGGLVGGGLGSQVRPVVDALRSRVAPALSDQQIDVRLVSALGDDFALLPEQVRQTLRADARRALSTGGTLDPTALRNLADFQAVGARPTRGMLSQDPGTLTREQNTAKLAANIPGASGPGSLPAMAEQNNAALIGRMNALRTGAEVNPLATGNAVVDAVVNTKAGLRGAERAAWNAVESHPGMTMAIEPNGLSAINTALGDKALMPFMSPGVSNYITALQNNPAQWTPQAYANLRSLLSGEQAAGGNAARAASAAIKALDDAPLIPIKQGAHIDFGGAPVPQAVAERMRQMDAAAGEAVGLVNQARGATRAAYAFEESSPMVQTIVAAGRSADPEKIAASYLLNSKATVADAERVREVLGPQGVETIRDGLATWIKKQALSGADDDVGKVSQASLRNVLKDADDRLGVFFSPEEVAQMRRIGRVATLIQNQPAGSAVNNSNTASAAMGHMLDFAGRHGAKVPMIGPAGQAASVAMSTRQANNVAPALLNPDLQRRLGVPSLLGPGAALAAPLALEQPQ